MNVAHNDVERAQPSLGEPFRWGARERYASPHIPRVTQHRTLNAVLRDHTFINYGTLSEYVHMHRKNIEHFAYFGAHMIQDIRMEGKRLDPKLQADMLVRYVMTKAQQAGYNPIDYISQYHMDHMTWQLADAGYTEGSIKLAVWNKLMELDRERENSVSETRRTTERRPQRIPLSPPGARRRRSA